MKFDQHIKEVALLGTSKRKIDLEQLPAVIADIVGNEEGSEAKLLAAIATDLFYKKAGTLPPEYQGEITGKPIYEDQKVAPKELITLFKAILEIEGPVRHALFNAWCQAMIYNDWIVSPIQIIPALNVATKETRDKIVQIIGKKGAWAIQQDQTLKKEYYNLTTDTLNIWEEGTTKDRVAYFKKIRQEDPSEAQSMLENT